MREIGKKIFVARGVRLKLMDDFKCADKTVWNALNFQRDNDLAKSIRKTAIEKYGGRPVGVLPKTILNAI